MKKLFISVTVIFLLPSLAVGPLYPNVFQDMSSVRQQGLTPSLLEEAFAPRAVTSRIGNFFSHLLTPSILRGKTVGTYGNPLGASPTKEFFKYSTAFPADLNMYILFSMLSDEVAKITFEMKKELHRLAETLPEGTQIALESVDWIWEPALQNALYMLGTRYQNRESGFSGVVTVRIESWLEHGIQCVISDNGLGLSRSALKKLSQPVGETMVIRDSILIDRGGLNRWMFQHFLSKHAPAEIVIETRDLTDGWRLTLKSGEAAPPSIEPLLGEVVPSLQGSKMYFRILGPDSTLNRRRFQGLGTRLAA